MKILIIENEHYLAQSIAAKLIDRGFSCELALSADEINYFEAYDVILLSTGIAEQDFYQIIKKYKNAIIILMVSYVNNDTVSRPMQAGASDYILKPFMIEELIRKIEHYKSHKILNDENKILKEYIDYIFNNITIEFDYQTNLPLIIKTDHQNSANFIAYNIAKKRKLVFDFVSLAKKLDFNKIKNAHKDRLVYVSDFHTLKAFEKEEVLSIIKNKNIVIATNDLSEEIEGFNVIELEHDEKAYEESNILSIEDYVKNVISIHQHKFPDTELSRRLGISRKSLWEKRKKYGIIKQK